MRVNVARAFNLGADDPEGWKKAALFTLVVAVCTLGKMLILPGLFLLLYIPGYLIQYTRNVATGDNENKLPEVLDLGGLWHGFIAFLLGVVYALPVMGVMFLAFGAGVVGVSSGVARDSAVMAGSGLAAAGFMGLVAMITGLIVAFFVPMVILQYVRNFQFNEGLQFPTIFSGILKSPVDYVVVVLLAMCVNAGLAMVPYVGWLIAPVGWLVGANLMGQYGASVLEMRDSTAVRNQEIGFSKF